MDADRVNTHTDARSETIRSATLELAQELGFAKLSIEAVAARAGVGKHTIYRRWPSKGALFLDAVLSSHETILEYPDTGDIVADLREQILAAVELLARPPLDGLFRSLLGEAQQDAAISAALNERFIAPQTQRTIDRLEKARDAGQLSPDLDLELAMSILSGPIYFQFLITAQPLTHDYIDRLLAALFAGLGPRP
ncbi:TetR family transcriptional regulator [Flexivirga endophytica]|uniref:TetR family transcriptional regulator n=1 Tax=Flexivirga endophytica TaxID=1849103 RepID=A0A916SYU7_9MICO|nr:TetR/AcrR family transcriptional regulator [Flexivirga endophytica]GGB24249.1 TetR family transcriptional regulator [Flexivirga endophytica]GHB62934.1 TetR family transcriptional regulator [Flexivirga endophytica]